MNYEPAFNTAIHEIFVAKIKAPLTLDEERALIAEAQLGDEDAKLRLLHAYAGLLNRHVNAAMTHSSNGITDVHDLRATAVLGLLLAIEDFDLSGKETLRLASSHKQVIRELGALSENASGFALPARTVSRYFKFMREADDNVFAAMAAAQATPNTDDRMTAETFLAVHSALRSTFSYHGLSEDEDGNTTADTAAMGLAYARTNTVDGYDAVEQRELVRTALAALDADETQIVLLAYGFSAYRDMSDDEVAKEIGSSRSAVQRKRAKAIGKMRAALGVDEED